MAFAPHLRSIAKHMAQAHLAPKDAPGSGKERASLPTPAAQPQYLAIQWRTEYALLQPRMDKQRMLHCAAGLINFSMARLKVRGVLALLWLCLGNGSGRA